MKETLEGEVNNLRMIRNNSKIYTPILSDKDFLKQLEKIHSVYESEKSKSYLFTERQLKEIEDRKNKKKLLNLNIINFQILIHC